MKNYHPVIGLEIHVELKTKSKMFCGCPAEHFGKMPNSQVCPICLGLPGALPVPNKKAIDWTILIGKALNCRINEISKFDRKHYFYPDLPKGYQISQYDEPIAINGRISFSDAPTHSRSVQTRITRVHLEEDTGKLLHLGSDTLVDFNRSGVPLVEIVTEPDFDNSDDVKRFLEELQVIIRYLGVSDADMEKGSMRLEPNISVREIRNSKFEIRNKSIIQNSNKKKQLPNYKVEVKNINSFKFVKKAIDYEVERQSDLLESGKTPVQETRGFVEKTSSTISQRSKEEAQDYRYFPEPDIPPMVFTNDYVKQIERQLPELPSMRVLRYVRDVELMYQDAFVLTRDIKVAAYFEAVIEKIENSSLSKALEDKQNYNQLIANFIINKKISINLSVDEFVKKSIELLKPKKTDEKVLDELINRLLKENKKAVEDYKKGKENAIMFLVGQVMRQMKGQVDAKIVIAKIKDQIAKI